VVCVVVCWLVVCCCASLPPSGSVPPTTGVVVPDEAPAEPAPLSALSPDVSVVVVEEVALVVDVEVGGVAAPVVGTVNGGAPLVSAEFPLPPPQAEIASAAASATKGATKVRVRLRICRGTGPVRFDRRSARDRIHVLAAPRAGVQILLGQLVAVVAEAQVLNRPRKL
jgi:hypothetical protein